MKKISITLVWGVSQYQVKAITNTIQYKPGQWLDVAEVGIICQLPNWEVMIGDNDFFKMFLDMGNTAIEKLVP